MAERGLRDDASIVPYTGLQCRKIAVFRLAAGPVRFVGNGLDRPQDLAPRQPGRYGIGPYGGAGGLRPDGGVRGVAGSAAG